MFTVKQVGPGFEKLWPRVSCVDASSHGELVGSNDGPTEFVTALFADGGSLEFSRGEREQTIYVMNENGSTVARYLLRGGLVANGIANSPVAA